MISSLTALQASESATQRDRWSYPLFADVLTKVDVDPARSRRELFKRVASSALVSNSDDHPRNHAMIADARGCRLPPAYDLLPNPQVAQYDRVLAMRRLKHADRLGFHGFQIGGLERRRRSRSR
ncbi:MAG: HipA domain-containing protein [Alphaproteobacteria bacterium]|nr:HipA domain-containing protein [Alphaproteobacteria bacterium]